MALDASSGFHDIKPLPEFTPIPIGAAAILLGIIAALIALYYFYRKRNNTTVATPIPPLPADKLALEQLRELDRQRKAEKIHLREFCSRLSLILRGFLEDSLKFPACESTTAEISTRLTKELKQALPTLSESKLDEFYHGVRLILRFCENATFSEVAESRYSLESDSLTEQHKQTEQLVRELSHWIKKEEERTMSVIDQGKAVGR